MSAIKSSVARIQEFEKMPKHNQAIECIVFPAIVIDGRLFESSVDDTGQSHVSEIEMGVLHWKGNNPINASLFVHIVTKHVLSQFVEQVDRAANVLFNLALKEMLQSSSPILTT